MLGGAKLTFSYEKICQDFAGFVFLLSIPVWGLVSEKFSLRPITYILAFVISEFLLGIAVFYIAYRGLWKFVSSDLKASLRYRASDPPPQHFSINSYSELLSWRKTHRAQ